MTMAGQTLLDLDHLIEDSSDDAPSLGERAATAARAELRSERAGILGAKSVSPLPLLLRPRRVPGHWSFIYVPPPQMAM